MQSSTQNQQPNKPNADKNGLLRIGRYVVLGMAGAGGMGTVYKAHDVELLGHLKERYTKSLSR